MTSGAGASETGGRVSSDTPGTLLKAARATRRWSVQQAAEQLHVDAWTIDAMEADRFASLGAPVFARGHLRKYAVALGLEPELLISRYDTLSQRPDVPTPKPTKAITERRRLRLPRVWLFVGVLVVVAGVAALWWYRIESGM